MSQFTENKSIGKALNDSVYHVQNSHLKNTSKCYFAKEENTKEAITRMIKDDIYLRRLQTNIL